MVVPPCLARGDETSGAGYFLKLKTPLDSALLETFFIETKSKKKIISTSVEQEI
jgi:hypothetical protein